MTHKLPDELRTLADKMPKIIRYGGLLSDERRDYDCPAADGLRRAANALDYLTEVVENFGQADKSAGLLMEQAKNKAVERAERAEARVARLEEALKWYASEWLYDLQRFRTAALLSEVDKPKNIEIEGNPIMHDRGKLARQAISETEPTE